MTTKSTRHERAPNENTFKTQIVENFNETECKTCYRRLRRVIDAFFESFKWLCLEREREKKRCVRASVCFDSEAKQESIQNALRIPKIASLIVFAMKYQFQFHAIIFFSGKLSGNQYQYWKRQKKNETHKDRISLSCTMNFQRSFEMKSNLFTMPMSRSCS